MSRDVKKASEKRSRSAKVNFRPVKRDIPVFDRGGFNRLGDDKRYQDKDPDDFDEILGNFGDWGSQ